jgi:hypothetical protein
MMAFALRMMAVVPQHDGADGKMMPSVVGVEDLGKKAMSGLPDRRQTLTFFQRHREE